MRRPLRALRRRLRGAIRRATAPLEPIVGEGTSSGHKGLYEMLRHVIPNDHTRQVTSAYYVQKVLEDGRGALCVLDLGCGDGRSIDLFRRMDPEVSWTGVDIESSPEVDERARTDGTFVTFDGVNLPFEDGSFDVAYSHQVFEHVRRPEPLLREVARVLRPGGAFIGSVSSLEPYHSFSYWSFTPFGWYTLVEDAGMTVRELRPGIDGIALVQRHYRARPPESRGWFASSPLNEEIDEWGRRTRRRPALINLRKLQYCGHLAFEARKAR
ncbi:MAG TPA: class I SAM-dependent methyltransferase [Sandaracinaceae bacterium LLY-WYZ-13_1]|nr:class I SAM-dependent methyltransferase [Sandaracinaceae bacterium LLY-WYZ-13_1]